MSDEGARFVFTPPAPREPAGDLQTRVRPEPIIWVWVALAFLLISGAIVQARVIPSDSMESTLLIGDHLLISRLGYDASLPFTRFHLRLWREPRRFQIVIFRAPIPGAAQDFIRRVVGMPGDTVKIQHGVVYVGDSALAEPYRDRPLRPTDNYGPLTVPEGSYFVLGDNRDDSFDSRNWGVVPEANILGTPVLIYMSVQAPNDAWQIGQVRERFRAYLNAFRHPHLVRWDRLLTFF